MKHHLSITLCSLLAVTALFVAVIYHRNESPGLLVTRTEPGHPLEKSEHHNNTQQLQLDRRAVQCHWAQILRTFQSSYNIDDLTECERAYLVGQHLLCMMNSPGGWESNWLNPNDPPVYGWDVDLDNPVYPRGWAMDNAFSLINRPHAYDASRWNELYSSHSFDSHDPRDGSIIYGKTGASYENAVNFQDGILMILNNEGPDSMKSRYGLAGPVPPLKQLSDLVFLALLALLNSNPANMRRIEHVFKYEVTTRATTDVLAAVTGFGNPDEGLRPWPGLSFPISSPEAKVIMSTPHGKGMAWLFGQHKNHFGVKVVDMIKIFACSDDHGAWCMYFHLVEGPVLGGL